MSKLKLTYLVKKKFHLKKQKSYAETLVNQFIETQNKKPEEKRKSVEFYEAKVIKHITKIDDKIQKVSAEIETLNIDLIAKNHAEIEHLTKSNHADQKKKIEIFEDFQEFQKESDSILKISHLSMHFGGLKAVNDLSFDVKKGEIFGLIGPNGAGKTTVFNCITQFYKPTHGEVYFQDKENNIHSLSNYKVHDIIDFGIARTFQNVELVWELSVLDNLLVGGHSLYTSNFFTQLFHLPKLRREENAVKKRALEVITKLGLTNYQNAYPVGLPYGILKRIELARTLMTNPSLIILDEPAAGLNDTETNELAELIKVIQKEFNVTIFLVEHDMNLVMGICDRICAISFGQKICLGTPEEIQNDKRVQEAYLGGD